MGIMKRIVKAAVALLLVLAMVMGNGSMTYAETGVKGDAATSLKLNAVCPASDFSAAMYIEPASTNPLVLAENASYDQVVTNGNSVITVPKGTTVKTLWILDPNTSKLNIGGTVNNLNVNSDMRNLQINNHGNNIIVSGNVITEKNNVNNLKENARYGFASIWILKQLGYGSTSYSAGIQYQDPAITAGNYLQSQGLPANSDINIQPITAAAVNDELCLAYSGWAAACMRAANPLPYKETIIDVPDIDVNNIHTGVVTTPTPTPKPTPAPAPKIEVR